MDILSYDDSNYSGGSRGGYRVIRPPLLPPKIEAPRAEKVFLETVLRPLPAPPPTPPPPPPLSEGLVPALNYTSSTTLSYGTVVQVGLN